MWPRQDASRRKIRSSSGSQSRRRGRSQDDGTRLSCWWARQPRHEEAPRGEEDETRRTRINTSISAQAGGRWVSWSQRDVMMLDCDKSEQIIVAATRAAKSVGPRTAANSIALIMPSICIIVFAICTPPVQSLLGPSAARQDATRQSGLALQRTSVGANVAQETEAVAASYSDQEQRGAAHWSLPNRPSLFSIIRFPNEECFDSSNQSGTCYTAFECKLLGGQPSSPCAAGFGSCCIVSRTCHVTTREKVVYFKNPSFPAADSDEKFCDLTVEMGDLNVCQLRLDFLDFQLDPPTSGACQDDYMEISASGMPPQTIPRLCGMNRNQHLYINVPQDLSERSASIVFYTDPVGDHRWQLKVTQIDCNHLRAVDWRRHYGKLASSPLWAGHPNGGSKWPPFGQQHYSQLAKYSTTFASGFQAMSQTASALAYELLRPQFTPRAPLGCLQYFTQPNGIIESFNFGQYLNSMDYSICIQRQPDTCRVVFSSSDYDWSLNGVGISGSSSGVGDQDCARDYLLIPGASRTGDGFTYDRYCGGRLHYFRGQTLSSPVTIKTSGPIVLRFHSDAHFEPVNSGGFRLQYDQSAQDCIYHTAEEAGSLASQQLLASTLADSRPFAAGPALYAAQQAGPAQIVAGAQQFFTDEAGAGSGGGVSPIRQLITASNNASAAAGTAQLGTVEFSVGNENENEQQQLESPKLANSIKRRHDQPTSGGSGRPQTPKVLAGRRRLAADLSQAFQLITGRSSRLSRRLKFA